MPGWRTPVGIIGLSWRLSWALVSGALYAFPGGDKVGHVALMGILSLLVNAAVAARTGANTTRRMLIATLVVTFVIAAEEFSQKFFPNRTMSGEDLACSSIGIWLVGFGGVMLWRRRLALRLS